MSDRLELGGGLWLGWEWSGGEPFFAWWWQGTNMGWEPAYAGSYLLN